MNSSVETPRKSEIGKTELNTAWSPVSSRSSGSMFIWRNRSYEFFCTSMRFGIWIAVRILEKLVLSREVLVLLSVIFHLLLDKRGDRRAVFATAPVKA